MPKFIFIFVFFVLSIRAEEIPLSYRGGVYHIPVTLNKSVRLEFVVDSGASTVYIPEDVFTTLLRTGTVSKNDILGTSKVETATGEVVETLLVNIRNLKIGNKTIYNVKTSVGSRKASLLLGQSALKKLEPWSIDSSRRILNIGSYNKDSSLPEKYTSNKISKNDILKFIDDYISRWNSRDLKGIMELYDNKVNYFKAGVVSRKYILNDKLDYYKRWPSLQISLLNIESVQDIPGSDREKLVKYRIKFDVFNYLKEEGIKGVAVNTVILNKKRNDEIKIIYDKQKIVKRRKYKVSN